MPAAKRTQTAVKSLFGQQFEVLGPLLKGLVTFFIAVLGTFMFAVVGSLAYPLSAVGAVIGAVAGFVVFGLLGVCATGVWRDLIPKDTKTFGASAILPHSIAVQLGGHGQFDMIVTVHKAIGVEVHGYLPWQSKSLFAEVECGSNPVKRTCVQSDANFNEQFKLRIEPTDECILVRIKDQDLFGIVSVGYASVNITKDVIEAGFPKNSRFPINARENDRLRYGKSKAMVELSFQQDLVRSAGEEDAARSQKMDSRPERNWSTKSYGAVNFLQKVEFNPAARVPKDAPDESSQSLGPSSRAG